MTDATLASRLRRVAMRRWERFRFMLHRYGRVSKKCRVRGTTVRMAVTNERVASRVRSYETKEPYTLRWIESYLKPGDTFFDVGANIGQYSIFAALHHERGVQVYSFEPESQNYAALNHNVYLNNLSSVVSAFCLALDATTGADQFYVRGTLRPGEAIHQFGEAVDDVGQPFDPVHQQGMVAFALDDLCFKHGLSVPNCIKIDVDGHERRVVAGGRRTLSDERVRSLLIEISESSEGGEDQREIYQMLAEAGFALVEKVPARVNQPDYPSYNVIFARKDGRTDPSTQ